LICLIQLCSQIKKNKIDVVVGHTPKGALLAMIASFLTRTPKRIYFKHGLVFETQRGLKKGIFIQLEKITEFFSSDIILVSNSLLNASKLYALGDLINVYSEGKIKRDFTFVDDIITGILKIINGQNESKYNIYNIGRGNPLSVNDFIKTIETSLGIKAIINHMPLQPGYVPLTYAVTTRIENDYNYNPSIDLKEGIEKFTNWYKSYYSI
jgi:hypothetical protein